MSKGDGQGKLKGESKGQGEDKVQVQGKNKGRLDCREVQRISISLRIHDRRLVLDPLQCFSRKKTKSKRQTQTHTLLHTRHKA